MSTRVPQQSASTNAELSKLRKMAISILTPSGGKLTSPPPPSTPQLDSYIESSGEWEPLPDETSNYSRSGTGAVVCSSASSQSAPPVANPFKHPQFQAFLKDLSKRVSKTPVGQSLPVTSAVRKPPGTALGAKKPRRPRNKPTPLDRLYDYRVGDAVAEGKKAWDFIKRYINVEEKMFTASTANATTDYNGSLLNLSNVAQGTDYNNRDGNSILVQRIQLRFALTTRTASTSNSAPIVRVMMLRDMLRNAAADPTPGDILETVGSTLAVHSALNHIHDGNSAARRFRVLLDETHALEIPYATTIAATTTGTVDRFGSAMHVGVHNISVGAHTLFQSTAGADASDWVGALYFFVISNVATDTQSPLLDLYSRMYFTDN